MKQRPTTDRLRAHQPHVAWRNPRRIAIDSGVTDEQAVTGGKHEGYLAEISARPPAHRIRLRILGPIPFVTPRFNRRVQV